MSARRFEITCIVCPNGCHMTVDAADGVVLAVEHALCNKGKHYAVEELVNPVRTLTTTVRVLGGELPLVSVRSDRPIPKQVMLSAVSSLRGILLEAPVKAGAVVVEDLLGTGARVIATKSVDKAAR